MNASHFFTTPVVEGYRIVEYKGLVTARNARAVNIIRDFFTSFRDIFGGRSASYETVMTDMENEVLAIMAAQAQSLGANAIIGFKIDFENIGSKRKSLIMAYGSGTAVFLQANEPVTHSA